MASQIERILILAKTYPSPSAYQSFSLNGLPNNSLYSALRRSISFFCHR